MIDSDDRRFGALQVARSLAGTQKRAWPDP
jgi:hypothetical protein